MEQKPKGSVLFSDDAKSFSFLGDQREEVIEPKTKEWTEILNDFLTKPYDLDPIGPTTAFKDLNTKRSKEFSLGNGSANLSEIKRKAKSEAKDLKRRSKK